ncbi:MAG: hypothetical protein AB7P52_13280 [Alphaproteobacteria bacterium]
MAAAGGAHAAEPAQAIAERMGQDTAWLLDADEAGGALILTQPIALREGGAELAYAYVVCKGQGGVPDQADCTEGKNGVSYESHAAYLRLASIDPGTITIEASADEASPRFPRVAFQCHFDRMCGVLEPPAFWRERSAILCGGGEACARLAADLSTLVALAAAAEPGRQQTALDTLKTLDCNCGDEGMSFAEAAERTSLLSAMLLGSRYAALRPGGPGVMTAMPLHLTTDEDEEWILHYGAAGCIAGEGELSGLIEACRSTAAGPERVAAKVPLYQLNVAKTERLDGAATDPAGQGFLLAIPCFGAKQCVSSESSMETLNTMLLPCRDQETCDEALRHLDYLSDEADWIGW